VSQGSDGFAGSSGRDTVINAPNAYGTNRQQRKKVRGFNRVTRSQLVRRPSSAASTVSSILPKPHPKRACQLQHSLASARDAWFFSIWAAKEVRACPCGRIHRRRVLYRRLSATTWSGCEQQEPSSEFPTPIPRPEDHHSRFEQLRRQCPVIDPDQPLRENVRESA
jgi:hypothetical protein